MAQSPEYPDLKWVPPRSWTNANRTGVQLIVIHTTEGSSHAQSAEDGAAYDARRTDGTSAHYFVDSSSVVQCVRTNDRAHTARSQGNRRGIQYELCGRASFSASKWQDDYCQAMLRRAAKQAARDARKWGIPVRHLTVAQVRDGVKGFCSHWDITRAFPSDGGTHTDPGPNFPWGQFLDMVRAELNPPAPPKPETEKPPMAFDATEEGQIRTQTQLGFYDALKRGSAAADDDPTTADDATGRQIRSFLDNLTKASATSAAVADLAALVVQDSAASAQEIADALAPLILVGLPESNLTQADVEAAVRNVLRTGTDS